VLTGVCGRSARSCAAGAGAPGQLVGVRRGQFRGQRHRQRPGAQPVGQGLALDILHRHEVNAVALADVVDDDDVRVVQAGGQLRFAREAQAPIGVGGKLRGQDLEGDVSIEPGIAGPVDLAHASAAKGGDDLVHADQRPRGKGHGAAIIAARSRYSRSRIGGRGHGPR